MAKPPQD